MGIHIFRTMNSFIQHIDTIEQENSETLFAYSYLSSHFFAKTILLRYFERDLKDKNQARDAADNLWKRSKRIHSNLKSVPYREIYELDALEEFCKNGVVHRQTPTFKVTPKETISVLQAMVALLNDSPLYEVAFCREMLPFVFIVKPGQGLTIDVRNNFSYQRIQGLLIKNDEIVSEF